MREQALRPLLTLALDQRGFVTPDDAAGLGVDPAQLRVLVHRGQLERRGRGVYRFPEVPVDEHDEYLEAVLLIGHGAVGSHESALALLDLCDVNPSRVHVTVPARERVRRQVDRPVEVHHAPLADGEVTHADGIPVVTAERAIRDGLATGTDSRLLGQALASGRRQGYLTTDEAAALQRALDARAGGAR
jgi:predicted transcriptional regulator of viral defense system